MSDTLPRLLYVDDDLALARLVQRGLSRHGLVVEHAPDAEAALTRLAQGGIDAVALDHYLGATTGVDLLPRLLDRPSPPAVIYVTSAGDTAIAVDALKAGAADYVAKSVGEDFLQLLATAIDQAIEKRRLLADKEAAERDVRMARDRAELLLREVNHRVANSLSLVSSMVGLQAHLLADKAAKDALAETQARIYAIGEIHKRLYTATDIRFVRIDEYLTSLVEHLDASLSAEGSGAEAVVAAEPLLVATDKAVSIGVAVTELVTNAFKYAYPNGATGRVELSLQKTGDNAARLSVRDYGVGWDESAPVKGTGLGTRIIRAMATSLGTEIVYQRRDRGTEVAFTFATQ